MAERSSTSTNSGFSPVPPRGMVMVRGRLGNREFASALAEAGCQVPGKGRIVHRDGIDSAWMSPDELLVMCKSGVAGKLCRNLSTSLRDIHHLAVVVSDMRAEFKVTGDVRDVLAKGTPADLSPENFRVGDFRRSRIGQVQAAFWLSNQECARLICRRSEAEYLAGWLERATAPGSRLEFYHRQT